jgi:quercetin dioxygenase-like cupin family protein
MSVSMEDRRFVGREECVAFDSAFAREEWLCRSDIVPNQQLLLVRATMQPGGSHPFHFHPGREEILYILSGRAEQWVGSARRILNPGDIAFVPAGEVHGTYNPHPEPLVFLAMLSPSDAPGPAMVDVSTENPWNAMRGPG